MIDEIRVQFLIEKMEIAQDASEKSYFKFYEILSLIDGFSSTVNGYPAQALDLLEQTNKKIDNLEKAIVNISYKINNTSGKKGGILFYHYILIFFLMLLGSFIGSIFYALLFNN